MNPCLTLSRQEDPDLFRRVEIVHADFRRFDGHAIRTLKQRDEHRHVQTVENPRAEHRRISRQWQTDLQALLHLADQVFDCQLLHSEDQNAQRIRRWV